MKEACSGKDSKMMRCVHVAQQEEKQRKRKGHDSPEGRRHKRPYHGPSHAMDWGHRPSAPPGYDSPQRMQRAYLASRAAGASPHARPSSKSSKSNGSPLKVSVAPLLGGIARAHHTRCGVSTDTVSKITTSNVAL